MGISIARRHFKIAGTVLAIAAVGLIADRLYESDREKIVSVIGRLAAAVMDANPEAIAAELTVDYHHDGMSRDDVLGMARAYFETYPETTIAILSRKIQITGQIASVDLNARAGIGASSFGRSSMATQWRFGLIYTGERWRVDGITPVRVAGREVADLKSLTRHLNMR